jgi:N-acetylmuramoyl-L-alanine amidase
MSKLKIFIDAGHNDSGWNTGAVGNNMREQDITFAVSFELGRLLEAAGCDVQLSRPTQQTNLGRDNNTAINARWQMANAFNADYFISIHVNAGRGTGAETFIAATKPQDRTFATTINDHYAQRMGLRNRGVKLDSSTGHGSLGVLRSTRMPAILVELAFIDSPLTNPDVEILRNQHSQMAQVLAEGFINFLDLTIAESIDPPEPPKQTFPITPEHIQMLVGLGVIRSPEFWRGIDNIQWLNELMLNDIMSELLDPRIHNGIQSRDDAFETALKVLVNAGIITSPDYWQATVARDDVQHIDSLIISMADRCLDPLHRIVWAEARGEFLEGQAEPLKGQAAVAEVVLNRTRNPQFPDGIANVIFQHRINSEGRHVYEFSPIGNGAYARATPTTQNKEAVQIALNGSNHAQGALFFRTIAGAEGSWHQLNLRQLVDIGGHRFYTNR